jgi:hypothetical protein
LGFKSFKTAEKTIRGIEVMRIIRKEQVECNHSSALSTVDVTDVSNDFISFIYDGESADPKIAEFLNDRFPLPMLP